jgi:DeoR/GlpR family transcriptional regulator of sugar metabolism
MIPAERQRFILASLLERGVLSIAELMDLLGVSHMTVRRDIQQLEKAGRVMLVSGGVKLPERLAFEPSHVVKSGVEHEQKVRIGRAAADLVSPGAVVYLDAGTTTLEIAHNLRDRDDLLVVTNDFVVAGFLAAHSACRLYHTGGQVERDNQSCVGNEAAETVARFNFDVAFISASSWVIGGISSPSELKRPVKLAAVHNARRSVLVTDSSKYGKVCAFNLLALNAFDIVVTDTGLSMSVVAEIERLGVKVIIAPENNEAVVRPLAARAAHLR